MAEDVSFEIGYGEGRKEQRQWKQELSSGEEIVGLRTRIFSGGLNDKVER